MESEKSIKDFCSPSLMKSFPTRFVEMRSSERFKIDTHAVQSISIGVVNNNMIIYMSG